MTTKTLALRPHLIVKDCPRAIAFYIRAFNAREVACYADKKMGGHIVYAELDIGGHKLSLTEEHAEWQNLAPGSLGGSPVVVRLEVDDAFAVASSSRRPGPRWCSHRRPVLRRAPGAPARPVRPPVDHLAATEKLSHVDVQRRIDEQVELARIASARMA